MTDTSVLQVEIQTGKAAADLLALQAGLEGAASGVARLGLAVAAHKGGIETLLSALSKQGFTGFSKGINEESARASSAMDSLANNVSTHASAASTKIGGALAAGLSSSVKTSLATLPAQYSSVFSMVQSDVEKGLRVNMATLRGISTPFNAEMQAMIRGTVDYQRLVAEAAVMNASKAAGQVKAIQAQAASAYAGFLSEEAHAQKLFHKVSTAEVREAEAEKLHLVKLNHKIAVYELKERLAEEKRLRAVAAAQEQAERAKFGTIGGFQVHRGALPAMNTGAVGEAAAALSRQRNAALGLSSAYAKLTPAVDGSKDALKRWSAVGKDAHDTARGLSGALGGLWMTYGQLIPLMAGFAVAASLKGAFTASKDFAYQMTFVGAVSGDTAEGIDKVSASLVSMAKSSMFKPLELAVGMRILTQAGMTTADALSTLPTVMALATVGETDLTTAAETATGVMHAFGLEVTDIGHIGDVIAKAAAISTTSVAAMSESMKQASTVAQQYDLGLTEVSVALVALAERNIKGQAAGTAFRNMMNELSAPTDKAQRALDKLGVSLYDEQGNTKNLTVVMDELRVSMAKFDTQSKNLLSSAIFGERGNKPFQAIMAKTPEEWAAMVTELEESNGFLEQSMARLQDSVEGRFKNMAANAQAALVSIGEDSEGPLKDLAGSLNDVFSNPTIIAGVKVLAAGILGLTQFVVDHAAGLGKMAAAYLAFKVGSGALLIIATVYVKLAGAASLLKDGMILLRTTTLTATIATLAGATATTAATAATGGMAVATVGATTATRALTLAMIANPIGALIVVVGLLVTAYLALRDGTNGAAKAAKDAHRESETAIGLLKDQTKATWDLVAAKEREMGLRKSEAAETLESVSSTRGKRRTEIATLRADPQAAAGTKILADVAAGKRGKIPAHVFNRTEIGKAQRLKAAVAEEAALTTELNNLKAANNRLAALNDQAELDRISSEARAKKAAGTQTVSSADLKPQGKGATSGSAVSTLDSLTKSMRQYGEQQDYAHESGVKASAGVKLLIKAYDALDSGLIGTGASERKLTEAEKDKLRIDMAVVEQGEVRRAQDENTAMRQAAEQKSIQDQVAHEQRLLDVRVQSGEITKEAAAILSDVTTERLRGVAIAAEEAEITKLLTQYGAASASGNKARAEDILNEVTKRVLNIGVMQQETEQTKELNAARANSDMNKWNKEHAESVAQINLSVDAFMREKEATLSSAYATEESARATEYANAVREKFANEILKAETAASYELLTVKTLLAQLDTTTDEGERAVLISGINEALVKYGALTDQAAALKKAQDGAAASAADLGRKVARAGTSMAVEMEKAFGKVGKSLGGVIDGFRKLSAVNAKYSKDVKATYDNKDLKVAEKERRDLAGDRLQVELDTYAGMAGAAASYFDEQSTAYKVLHGIEMALHAAKLATKMAEITTNAIVAASGVASSTVQAEASGAELLVQIALGIAKQANGDPYTAFARMAAMAALMVGVAAIAGVAFGGLGGGGGGGPSASEIRQESQGTGTVLGDPNAKSNSLANALEMLADVNELTMRYSARMARSLQSIEIALTGVSSMIFRTPGLISGSVSGVQTGKIKDGFGLSSTKVNVSDSGLNYKGKISGIEAGLQMYEDVTTTKTSWYGKKKSSTTTNQVDAPDDISRQFQMIFDSIGDSLVAAGAVFGESTKTMTERLDNVEIDLGMVSLKGLKGEELEDALNAVISASADDIAREVLPGLEKYQKVGEGYYETAVRVAYSTEVVQASLKAVGKGFIGSELAIVDFSQTLIDSFGDLETLTEAISEYYDLFTTDAEKFADSTVSLSDGFRALGYEMPKTKGEFTDMVNALDLTTVAGADTYASLMRMAPAFATLANQIEDAMQQIAGSFAGSVEQIMLDVMGPEQQYNYWRTQADAAYLALTTATDPAEIQKLWDAYNTATMNAWSLIPEEQKANYSDEYIDYLGEGNDLATGKLSDAQATAISTNDALVAAADAITTAAEKFEATASAQQEAADKNLAAAQTPLTVVVDVNVDTPASVEASIS